MKLTTNYNDEVIDNPDDDAILNACIYTVERINDLYGESVMLVNDPEDEDERIPLVQAMYRQPEWDLLVTRRAHDEQQWDCSRAVEGPFATMRIVEILRQHAKGDDSWQHDLHWEPVRAISVKTLGILLAIFIIAVLIVVIVFL